jgi:hypothetical protein
MKKVFTVILMLCLMTNCFVFFQAIPETEATEAPPTEWIRNFQKNIIINYAKALIQTKDGSYVFTGFTGNSSMDSTDSCLGKVDSSGNLQWIRVYGEPGINDRLLSVYQTFDGGFIMTGYIDSFRTRTMDAYVIKTNTFGDVEWSKTYGTEESLDEGYSVIQVADGGYVIAGHTTVSGRPDVWLMKLNSFGEIEWSETYGGSGYDMGHSIVETKDGGFIIVGQTNSFGSGDDDFYLVKTDSAGVLEWSETYGGSGSDIGHSVVQTVDGGFALGGESTFSGDDDFYLVKTDSAGVLEWSETYGGSGIENGGHMVQTSDAGFALTGRTYSGAAGNADVWLVKTDSAGVLEWSETYDISVSDSGFSLIQTSDNGYAIAGYAGYNFLIIKTEPEIISNRENIVDMLSVRAERNGKFILGEEGIVALTFSNDGETTLSSDNYEVKIEFWDIYAEGAMDSFWLKFKNLEDGLSYLQLAPNHSYLRNFYLSKIEPGSSKTVLVDFPIPKGCLPTVMHTDRIILQIQSENGFSKEIELNNVNIELSSDSAISSFKALIIEAIQLKIPGISIITAFSETLREQAEIADSYTSKLFDSCSEGSIGEVGANAAKLACVLVELNPSLLMEERVKIIPAFAENFIEGPLSLYDSYVFWTRYKNNIFLDYFDPMELSFIQLIDAASGLLLFTDPVNICIIDPKSRQSGFNPNEKKIVNDIPDALIFEVDGNIESIYIPYILDGQYDVYLSAIDEEHYSLKVEGVNDSEMMLNQSFSGSIKKGEVLHSEIIVKETQQGLEIEANSPSSFRDTEMDKYVVLSIAVITVLALAFLGVYLKFKKNQK